MIITCPNCQRRFELRSKKPNLFVCPKCNHRAPFQSVVGDGGSSPMDVPPAFDAAALDVNDNASQNQETQVFNQQPVNQHEPTRMVVACGHLHVLSRNSVVRDITLSVGMHTLGRMSTDSQATIKIAPDPYMSRIHASMKIDVTPDGQVRYVISPAKPNNPVVLDNSQLPFGKSAILRNGCKIRMGETEMMFVIK